MANTTKRYKAVSYAAGRGRAVVRHWVVGPNHHRGGHYPTREAAEAEADALNKRDVVLAAISKAST